MTLLLSTAALLVLAVCGYSFARAADPCAPLSLTLARAHLCGAAALALGVTLGLAASEQPTLIGGVGGLFLLLLMGLVRKERRTVPGPTAPTLPFTPLEWTLTALLGVGVLTVALRVVLLPLDWDGWAIWQLKAKALADGTLRTQLTSPEYGYSHPDYPLLLPAHTWWLSGGGFSEKVAQAGGLLFFLDLLVLFYWEARSRVPRAFALAGCVAIASWAVAAKHAASGFADVPLAAYVLAVAAAASRAEGWLLGPLLAGAVLTKNEGLFPLAATGLWLLVPAVRRSLVPANEDARTHPALVVLGGLAAALPGLLAWGVTKRRWSLKADLLDPTWWDRGALAHLPERLGIIAGAFVRQGLSVGPRYPGWGLLWPLALAGLVLSMARRRGETLPFWLYVGVHFAGTVAAFAVTASELSHHMSTALDRLWLHVAPVALLATLMAFHAEPASPPSRFDTPTPGQD